MGGWLPGLTLKRRLGVDENFEAVVVDIRLTPSRNPLEVQAAPKSHAVSRFSSLGDSD